MKKKTIALAVGLTLCVGLCGGGLAACGGKTDPPPANTDPYYLAGASKSDLFGDKEWYEKYETAADIPDAIHFSAGTEADTHTITVNLYKGDTIQILKAGDGWTGQMGYNHVAETLKVDGAQIIEGDGYDIKNMLVDVTGEYTFTVSFDEFKSPIVNYTYNKAIDEIPTPATAITLNKQRISLGIDAEKTLTAKVTPTDTTDTVVWSSADESIATVDQEGKVKGIAKGTTIVTATAGDKTANCAVTVLGAGEEIAATAVTLADTEKTLHVGDEYEPVATIAPEDSTDELDWSSSDEDVVAVDATTGEITAKGPGTATVTATARTGVSAEVEITVAPDYFLRGAYYNSWAHVTKLGEEDVCYFTETTTKGVYKSSSVELAKGSEFMIGVVGAGGADNWDGKVDNHALPDDGDTLDWFAASGDSNIKCRTHGKYTFTLDLTDAENPSLTAVQDEDLPNPVMTDALYLVGTINSWTTVDTEAGAGDYLMTNTDGVYTVTVELAVGAEFKIVAVGKGWSVEWNGSLMADKEHGLGGNSNIVVYEAGEYTITLDTTGADDVITYTKA